MHADPWSLTPHRGPEAHRPPPSRRAVLACAWSCLSGGSCEHASLAAPRAHSTAIFWGPPPHCILPVPGNPKPRGVGGLAPTPEPESSPPLPGTQPPALGSRHPTNELIRSEWAPCHNCTGLPCLSFSLWRMGPQQCIPHTGLHFSPF